MLLNSIKCILLAEQSWAVQLTSSEETLWNSFSTAKELKPEVNGDIRFRIASIFKAITIYALLIEKSIDLNDPVTLYIGVDAQKERAVAC